MRNRLALAAAAMALAGPSLGGASVAVHRREPSGPLTDWMRANGKLGKRPKKITRSLSNLQLQGWKEIPCDAPAGYFWHQDTVGKRKWRLYKCGSEK